MALVDPNIAMSFRTPETPNLLGQYAQMAQIQSGQQAQQLNALKMQEAQAAMQERNALRQLDPSSPDYGTQLMRVSPTQGIAYSKSLQEAQTAKATRGKMEVETAAARQKFFSQGMRDLSSRPDDEQITTYLRDAQESPFFTAAEKQKVEQNAAKLLSMSFEDRKAYLASQGATAGDLSTAESARLGRVTTERGQDITAATALAGQQSTAATAKAGQGVTLRGQNLLDAREKENIAIRQEDQRRKGDPAFVAEMANARATGEATAKDQLLAAKVLPKVLDTAAQTLSQIDSLIGQRDAKGNLVKGAAPHPGFQDVVGATYLPGARFVPGTAASDFQTRFDQIKGGAFLQAFETLKGGGSITNIEGEKGTAALNRMSIAQSEKEFVQAAREFQDVIRTGVQRAQAKVPGAAPASNLDALLNKYK